jgi:hypothetical protein
MPKLRIKVTFNNHDQELNFISDETSMRDALVESLHKIEDSKIEDLDVIEILDDKQMTLPDILSEGDDNGKT